MRVKTADVVNVGVEGIGAEVAAGAEEAVGARVEKAAGARAE